MRFDAQDGLHLRKIISKQNTSGPMLKESPVFQTKEGSEQVRKAHWLDSCVIVSVLSMLYIPLEKLIILAGYLLQ